MKLTCNDIARMMDLSAVRASDGEQRVRALAAAAKERNCIIATTLSSQVELIVDLLSDAPGTGAGGNIGFPSGGTTRQAKVAEAKEMVALGCVENDMVIDIGKFLSGRNQYVLDEIKAVVEASAPLPVKVIIECPYLSDDQILTAAELCVRGGASFVKTGTGWAPGGATPAYVTLIKSVVGDEVQIKASGGIRGLDMLVELYRCGARRFGIGLGHEGEIFDACAAMPGSVVEV